MSLIIHSSKSSVIKENKVNEVREWILPDTSYDNSDLETIYDHDFSDPYVAGP